MDKDNLLSLGDLRSRASKSLASSGVERAEKDVDLFLSHVLSRSRVWLHSHPEYVMTEEELSLFYNCLDKRSKREPLHYIIGSCPFWDFDVKVGPGVLIPRPETEFLVEAALNDFEGGAFLDWGTGSGCISIAILKERPSAFSIAVEKNPLSLITAYENFSVNGLLDRLLLWHSRRPDDIPLSGDKLDLIVSNPPYIPKSLVPGLMKEVSCYEPWMALDGGEDGLDPYRMLLPWSERALKTGRWLWTEIGGDEQLPLLRDMTPSGLKLERVLKDLAGITRILGWRRV